MFIRRPFSPAAAAAVVILAAVVALPAGAQNDRRILPLSSPVYRQVDLLYLELGLAPASQARPWSQAELGSILGRIDESRLSGAGRRTLAQVERNLRRRSLYAEAGPAAFNAGLELNLEHYLHVPLSSSPPAAIGDYVWTHGYEQRLPVFTVPLELWLWDSLYAAFDLTMKEEHGAVSNPGLPGIENNRWNLPDPSRFYIDLYFPFRAFVSLGGDHWDVQLGRDSLNWGNGLTGNFLLSEYADFYDFLRAATWWKRFRIELFYAELDPWEPSQDGSGGFSDVTYKSLLAHRLELRILERVLLAVTESAVFANTFPTLIKNFNPLMIYHNWANPDYNIMLTAELTVSPWRYVNLYGQFDLDELTLGIERQRLGRYFPNMLGWLLGFDGAVPLGPGYLGFAAEYAHTDPWLYNRDGGPYFTYVRRIKATVIQTTPYFVLKPLGYQEGPDALVGFFALGYSVPDLFAVQLDLKLAAKGERTLQTKFAPVEGEATPTGTPEYRRVVHLHAQVSPWEILTFGTDLYFIGVMNAGHASGAYTNDLEWAASVQLRL